MEDSFAIRMGRTIKMIRVMREMDQGELSERAEVSKGYISLIENGKRNMQLSSFEKICRALDVPATLVVFMAADDEELASISPELVDLVRQTTVALIRASNQERWQKEVDGDIND